MRDWNGKLEYRRRNLTLATGDTFLFDAGELFLATPANAHAGAFRVLEITPETFEAACRAEGSNAAIHFARIVEQATPELEAALDALQRAILNDAEPLEQQSHLAALAHAALRSVLENAPLPPARPVPLGPCARLREILHSTESTQLNLSDFARHAGVSQFRLLRTFKRHYGYPPHAYGLHVRVERARQMLRRGFTVAEAAAANDFTDQSHLTRHFRRIWGVTPGVYATGSSFALPPI
jgi:AraC-like DNA-binding protein